MVDDDKFLIVPMGKESKAITQVISNDTAMQVMDLLADGPMSTSTVAEKLSIPLTTAQYNIEKLMESGLVKIEKTKYSEKGREVKLYRASRRLIMIVPEKSGGQAVIDALKKYILLIPIAAAISVAVEYLDPIASYFSPKASEMVNGASDSATGSGQSLMYAMPSNTSTPPGAIAPIVAPGFSPEVHQSLGDQVIQGLSSPFQHAGVLFFAGCLLVLLLLVVLEYVRARGLPGSRK